MRNQLLSITALCAAGLVLGAQAQSSSSDPSSSTSSSTLGSSGQSSSQSGWSGRHHMGMGQQELRTSQLTGAQINGSSGQQIGTISDTIVNPNSGRLDFAVVSLSEAGSSGSSTSSTSSTSVTTGTSSASGKQVAVPWMLLRPGSMGSTAQTTTTAGQTTSFVFNGDASKLQSAPNFDATTDLSQPSWRQSVFSYFGLSGSSSATGGAESPGSSSTSSGGTSSPDTSGSSSTGTSSGSSSSSTTPHSSNP